MRRPFLVLALALGSCTAPHDTPTDASPPPLDADACGTIGAACATDAECGDARRCVLIREEDAGPPRGVCVPVDLIRGVCGSIGGPMPCPTSTDLCVDALYAADHAECFQREPFACLCRSEIIREGYDCGALTR